MLGHGTRGGGRSYTLSGSLDYAYLPKPGIKEVAMLATSPSRRLNKRRLRMPQFLILTFMASA